MRKVYHILEIWETFIRSESHRWFKLTAVSLKSGGRKNYTKVFTERVWFWCLGRSITIWIFEISSREWVRWHSDVPEVRNGRYAEIWDMERVRWKSNFSSYNKILKIWSVSDGTLRLSLIQKSYDMENSPMESWSSLFQNLIYGVIPMGMRLM